MMTLNKKTKTSKIAKLFVLVLAVCYMLSPLQQTLRYGLHNIEHVISQVEADHHTHKDLMSTKMGRRAMSHHHSHETHQHKSLAFFNALFDDSTSQHNNQSTDISFDKHVLSFKDITFKTSIEFQQHLFYYKDVAYGSLINLDSPPPELIS